MEAKLVIFRHDIEEEGICVVVEGLVIQEHLGHQTQVLCVSLIGRITLTPMLH